MRDFFIFLVKPYEFQDKKNNRLVVLLTAIIVLILTLGANVLAKYIYVNHNPINGFNDINKRIVEVVQEMTRKYGTFVVYTLACIISPFVEELVCRLGLSFKKKHIYVSIISLVLYFPFLFNLNYISIIVSLTISISLVLLTYNKIEQSNIDLIKVKYGVLIFNIIVFAFAVLHLTNLAPLKSHLFIEYMVYLFPKLSFSYISSYIRLRIGFIYSVIFHSLFNCIISLVVIGF